MLLDQTQYYILSLSVDPHRQKYVLYLITLIQTTGYA